MLRVFSSTGMKISPLLAPHFFHLVYSHPMTSNCLPLLGLRQDLLNGVPASNLTLPKAVFHRAGQIIFQRHALGHDHPLLKPPMKFHTLSNNSKPLTRSVSPQAHPPHSN